VVGRGAEAARTLELALTVAVSEQLTSTFHRTVDEGYVRLTRTWPALMATGAVGGADLCLGAFGLFVVFAETGDRLLGAIAFASGFVALVLAGSELFTENFLVPVASVVARDASLRQLLRLWLTTLVANVVAAWVLTGLIIAGFPQLRGTALVIAAHPASQRASLQTMASAILAGATMTLMTWMERATESVPAKVVVAVMVAFLLVGGQMDHSIVGTVEMFSALHAGAPFGYLSWLRFLGLSVAGNMIGGLALVTMLRLVQVGAGVIRAEQERDPTVPREEDVPLGADRPDAALRAGTGEKAGPADAERAPSQAHSGESATVTT
jgi:formate/nitrite transporter FocA (FNT family)